MAKPQWPNVSLCGESLLSEQSFAEYTKLTKMNQCQSVLTCAIGICGYTPLRNQRLNSSSEIRFTLHKIRNISSHEGRATSHVSNLFARFTSFFERFTQLFESFRIFSNVFESFQSFSNVFILPILPSPCKLTHSTTFLPQKLTSLP